MIKIIIKLLEYILTYTNIVNNFGNLIHALWSEKETINSIFAAKIKL